MEGEVIQSIEFPLDLVCPDCRSAPVDFTVGICPDTPDLVDVHVSCPCGRRVNYGSVPAKFVGGKPTLPPNGIRNA